MPIRSETATPEEAGIVGRVNPQDLLGWLPVDAFVEDKRAYLRWMDFSGVALREPLFEQTVKRVVKERPEAREIVTDLDVLIQLEKIKKGLRPSGFIFHVSRCGSTLIANALRSLDDTIMVSEAEALEKLVGRLHTEGNAEGLESKLRLIYLRGIVNVFGQPRRGGEKHYFIKFSCWSVLLLDRIRCIWPDVPCVFVYREPVEVIVSNLRNPAGWMSVESNPVEASAMISGASLDEALRMTLEEYVARSVGRFCAAVAERADERMLLINYNQLSVESLIETANFFGVSPDERETAAIVECSELYAKDALRSRSFRSDAEEKRLAASPLAREMAERWAREPFLRLESLRLNRSGRQEDFLS
jgi:hypothetical protein